MIRSANTTAPDRAAATRSTSQTARIGTAATTDSAAAPAQSASTACSLANRCCRRFSLRSHSNSTRGPSPGGGGALTTVSAGGSMTERTRPVWQRVNRLARGERTRGSAAALPGDERTSLPRRRPGTEPTDGTNEPSGRSTKLSFGALRSRPTRGRRRAAAGARVVFFCVRCREFCSHGAPWFVRGLPGGRVR
jgi:hypothetical protein